MENIHGVVGACLEVAQHAHALAFHGGGGEDDGLEVIVRDGLGAGEGEEEAAGLDLLEGLAVEVAVSFDALLLHLVVLGEGGRVEHDKVVTDIGGVLEKVKDVLGEGSVALEQPGVEGGDITFHVGDGLLGYIDGIDADGAAGEGIAGESAGIAEEIEHASAGGVLADKLSVVALVEEKAGLLPARDVDMEGHAVLAHSHLAERAIQQTIDGDVSGDFREGGGALVIDGAEAVAEDIPQRLREGVAQEAHAVGVELHDHVAVVPIDDQPGQVVALAVHQAEGGGVGAVEQAELPTEVDGLLEFGLPEGGVRFHLSEREDLDTGGTVVIVTSGEVVSVVIIDLHAVAVGEGVVFFGDGAGEDPRMEALQRLFLASLEDDAFHG